MAETVTDGAGHATSRAASGDARRRQAPYEANPSQRPTARLAMPGRGRDRALGTPHDARERVASRPRTGACILAAPDRKSEARFVPALRALRVGDVGDPRNRADSAAADEMRHRNRFDLDGRPSEPQRGRRGFRSAAALRELHAPRQGDTRRESRVIAKRAFPAAGVAVEARTPELSQNRNCDDCRRRETPRREPDTILLRLGERDRHEDERCERKSNEPPRHWPERTSLPSGSQDVRSHRRAWLHARTPRRS
jgi:hypothetical protein